MAKPAKTIDDAVEEFKTALGKDKTTRAGLREQWLAIEKAASEARRAYMASAMGDDNFSKAASLVRSLAPAIFKTAGTGGLAAAATSLLANSSANDGIIGTLKSLLVLPGITG